MSIRAITLAFLLCLWPLLAHSQSDAYKLFRILQEYTENYGGLRDADALSSLLVEGTIMQGGKEYEFQLRKKRPYSLHYRLSSGLNNVVTVYNGSSGWIRKETQGEVSIETLEADDLRNLRELSRFESPLFRHLEKSENEVTLLEILSEEAGKTYVIHVEDFYGDVSIYHLEAYTANVIRCDQLDENGDIRFQTFYRDYKDVGGFPFAHEIENRIGDEIVSLVQVRSVRVNSGVLSFYFEKPRR